MPTNSSAGSRVLHQIPEGSITPSSSPSALRTPLFSFDAATPYLIPTQQFCDRLLTFCVNHYRIIGYPVCIREGRYSRNEFIFNWVMVVEEGLADWFAYGEVVRKVGRLLRGLEEQGGFVSSEEDAMGVWDDDGEDKAWRAGSGSKVFALCEMLLEDLNNYAECMIPIGMPSCLCVRPPMRTMLNLHRRFQHDQSQALPLSSASTTHPRTPSPHSRHFPLLSQQSHLLGPYLKSHPSLHRRHSKRRADRRARRYGPFTHPQSHSAPRLLWLPRPPRHLQLRRRIRAHRRNRRFHSLTRCAGRMPALRTGPTCSLGRREHDARCIRFLCARCLVSLFRLVRSIDDQCAERDSLCTRQRNTRPRRSTLPRR